MFLPLGALHAAPETFSWLKLVSFLGLVVLSALSSGAEVAFLTLTRIRRHQLLAEGVAGIKRVEALMEHPQRFLITILIFNNLVNIAAAALATSMAIDYFGEGGQGVAIATGVTTFLVLTFGEIMPKAYATLHNEKVATTAAPIVWGMQRALWPIVRAYEGFTMWLLRRFGATDMTEATRRFASEEELRTMIRVGAEEGVLEQAEERMLHSVIEFGDTVAKEIMVPRIDVVAITGDASLESVKAYVMESGYSRIPVYERNVDNVVGILYIREMLTRLVSGGGGTLVREIMREAYFVPDNKYVAELLSEMREKRIHMAVVLDEFGGTAGIVTMEDVLEEIVGEIFDEYDMRQDPIRKLDGRTALVDARTHIDDVNAGLGTAIPEDGPYESLGGFISHELGHLGREGEVVHHAGAQFVVDRGTHRRILRVRIVLPAEAAETAGDRGSVPAESIAD